MSIDATVTKDLMQTLEDGKEGYARGAEKLNGTAALEIAGAFRRLSDQRATYYTELETLAKTYGDEIEESGSIVGTIHRGWMALKDAISGDGPEGVLDAAEQGEDHAVDAYEKALKEDLSPTLRTVVQRQFGEVTAAHDDVRSLRNAHR